MGEILGPETPNLHDSYIIIVLPYYMIKIVCNAN